MAEISQISFFFTVGILISHTLYSQSHKETIQSVKKTSTSVYAVCILIVILARMIHGRTLYACPDARSTSDHVRITDILTCFLNDGGTRTDWSLSLFLVVAINCFHSSIQPVGDALAAS